MLAAMPDLHSGVLAAATVVAALLGYVASRLIVAESDAHRMGQPDRWRTPLCTTCGEPLTPSLLRCTYAQHPQSLRNGVVVVVTVAVFAAIVLTSTHIALVPAYLAFAAAMILLTLTDLDTLLIPNRILWPATWVGAVLLLIGALIAGEWSSFVRGGAGGAIYFAVMFVLALIAAGALGFGDVKLALLMGLHLGWAAAIVEPGWAPVVQLVLYAILLGNILGVVGGLSVAMLRRRDHDVLVDPEAVDGQPARITGHTFPFGPALLVGAYVVILTAESIVTG